jgi:hypothetical protein
MYAVLAHVNLHEDVVSKFCGLCRKSKWFEIFDTIYLLYLGPEDDVTNLVSSLVTPPIFEPAMTGGDLVQPRIVRIAISKDSITCLRDLQWPTGCSLMP